MNIYPARPAALVVTTMHAAEIIAGAAAGAVRSASFSATAYDETSDACMHALGAQYSMRSTVQHHSITT